MKRVMKKTLAALALGSLLAFLPGATCAEARQDLKFALDATQIGCVLANALMPSSEAIAEACSIDKALVPAIDELLAEGVAHGLTVPGGAAGKAAAKMGVKAPK